MLPNELKSVPAPVDQGGVELVDQVLGAEHQLDAVEAAFLAAPRGLAKGFYDAAEVPVLHLLWKRTVGMLARRRGRDQGQPVGGVPAVAPAHVGDLAHGRGAVAVHPLRELLEIGNHRIVVDRDLTEVASRRFRRHRRRAAEDGQADAALCLLGVVELVALGRHAVLRVPRRMGRRHDPVADRQVLDGEGLEERVVLGHGVLPVVS